MIMMTHLRVIVTLVVVAVMIDDPLALPSKVLFIIIIISHNQNKLKQQRNHREIQSRL